MLDKRFDVCTLCKDEIDEYEEHMEGLFNDTPVFFCTLCIEAMSELVEEYYVHRYKEYEQATVH
jgi:hypothetical protein